MDAVKINNNLIRTTCENSCFETSRNYISLSNCHLTTQQLIDQYKNGFKDSMSIRLKCYKGYQMERDLIARLRTTFGDLVTTGTEISVADGLIKGHPDFEFDAYPGDCKSVLKDDWIPNHKKLPRKVYWQIQGYMLYMKKNKSLVIYESRESGYLQTFLVFRNARIQAQIEAKINDIIDILIDKK